MTNRSPAVAGLFYPANPQLLENSIRGYLEEPGHAAEDARHPMPPPDTLPKALIVPHAGFEYSGPVAASGYRLLAAARDRITRVVLLGPAHRVYVEGMAIPDVAAFDYPGGSVMLDSQALRDIARLPGVSTSNEAHENEHCLEVQLPFLDAVLDDYRLVPILIGVCPSKLIAAVLNTLWGGDETLILVSSDLSHFLTYDEALTADQQTTRDITARSISLRDEQACGARAINGLMEVARARALEVDVIDLRNSGDTAGDRSRVVGYGAYALR
ncbi:MAG: AmmeMemoRadiSam system protein B [Pseudomonadales bacterium]